MDIIYEKEPILKTFIPSLLKTISNYIPGDLIDTFHYFEKLLNDFMEIYRSELPKEKVIEIQKYYQKIH